MGDDMYYVKQTGPQLWTVGHDIEGWGWNPIVDFDNAATADRYAQAMNELTMALKACV